VQQWLGIVHVTDALRLILAIVRDAEHGIGRRELIASIQEEAPHLSATSAGKQIALARGPLGLVEQHENDVIRPTALGRQLLDGESPASVLTPMLIRRVWGFAQALDALRAAPEGITRVDLVERLRVRNGAWTSTMAASALVEWCKDLELVEIAKADGQQVVWLSETGEAWAARVPADMTAWNGAAGAAAGPAPVAAVDANVETVTSPAIELTSPPFDDVAARFAAEPASARLVLPEHLLALLHGALHALPRKRFVLLSGLSGTGKTSIAEAYARAYCAATGAAASTNLLRVPVSPDWSDPAGLLGYVSPLGAEPSFQVTQALELVLRAANNPTEPFFLVLDEMNLARVEHYFAPFLSAMEGENAMLVIHGTREAVDNVPPSIPWPRNLFILGTVNMDETTHAFSDKVLDRAFSFELWEVDLEAWSKAAVARGVPGDVLGAIMPPLQELHAALREARRHFGYRTCDEVLGFCVAAPPAVGVTRALDAAVLAKILPKVRGDDAGPLAGALEKVEHACNVHGLAMSAAKVAVMRDSLRSLGVVRFSS
jgi:MoxR-like ATPase